MPRPSKSPKNDRDVRKALRKGNVPWEECSGSHRKAKLPDGSVMVWHNHGEFGKGLASKLKKALLAAGLLGFAICALTIWFGDLIVAIFSL
jgi:hypothetical protein